MHRPPGADCARGSDRGADDAGSLMTDASQTPGRAPGPAARKVAGARRNPSVYGVEQTAPRWLRNSAGVSWRLLVVIAMVALIFFAHRRRCSWCSSRCSSPSCSRRSCAPSSTSCRGSCHEGWPPRWRSSAGSSSSSVCSPTWRTPSRTSGTTWPSSSATASTQITDFLESGKLPFTITNDQIATWISNGQKWVQDHAGDLAGQAAAGAGSVVEVFARSRAGDLLHGVLPVARPRHVDVVPQPAARPRPADLEGGGRGRLVHVLRLHPGHGARRPDRRRARVHRCC